MGGLAYQLGTIKHIIMLVMYILYIAISSNCGNFLRLLKPLCNKLTIWKNSQPIPLKDAVQRLNDDRSFKDLRYSLVLIEI